jgi:hypothetical protein
MSTKEIKAKTPEWFDFDLAYEITKFNFSYPTPTGSYITQSFNSGKFGADIKQQFEGLATGDVVYFSKFEYKIKGKKGTYRMSTDQPIVITIL